MGRYKIVFRRSVAKDLRPIPKKDVKRILKTINRLAENPRCPGAEKLTGEERYRIRQGQYRILYEIRDEEVVVFIVKIGHRREIYRS